MTDLSTFRGEVIFSVCQSMMLYSKSGLLNVIGQFSHGHAKFGHLVLVMQNLFLPLLNLK